MYKVIAADFGTMVKNYCKHNKLNKPCQTILDDAKTWDPKSTSCCIQMSHALNAANVKIFSASSQRPCSTTPTGNGFYLLNVAELEEFLTGKFDPTDDIKSGGLTMDEMKTAIFGRQGILVFRDGGAGYHTELWNLHDIVQQEGISGGMSEKGIFSQPRVLFWEVTKAQRDPTMPEWLTGWWSVNDGTQYYYHFLGLDYVYWSKSKPANDKQLMPAWARGNYGTVAMKADGPVVTWDKRGDGSTVETFRKDGSTREMVASSTRFGWMRAKKLF